MTSRAGKFFAYFTFITILVGGFGFVIHNNIFLLLFALIVWYIYWGYEVFFMKGQSPLAWGYSLLTPEQHLVAKKWGKKVFIITSVTLVITIIIFLLPKSIFS